MIQVAKDKIISDNLESIQIKIDAHQKCEKVAPFLGEIGVLTTAINRHINDLAAVSIYGRDFDDVIFNRQLREPNLVETELREVRNGSVIIDAAISASNFISTNQAGIIQGLIATAIWTGGGNIAKHLSRAAKRLGGRLIYERTLEKTDRIEPKFDGLDPANETDVSNSQAWTTERIKVLQNAKMDPQLRIIEVTLSGGNGIYIAVIAYDADRPRGRWY